MFSKGAFSARSFLWTSVVSLILSAPALAQQSPPAITSGQASSSGAFYKPVLFAGLAAGSFLKPAARIDILVPSRNSWRDLDLVVGAAAGRHGYEISGGFGSSDEDGCMHLDIRGVVTRATGQTSLGVEFTPIIALGNRGHLVGPGFVSVWAPRIRWEIPARSSSAGLRA